MIKAKYFKCSDELRRWFEENHNTSIELILGYYKKATNKPSVTWSESVDQALCFGWIDSIKRTINKERYCIRFTPRNPKSHWSAVNIAKVKTLKAAGLMKKEGLEAFSKMDPKNSEKGSYESRQYSTLSKKYVLELKKNKVAWQHFSQLAPGYKRNTIHWIMSAKREETISRRLKILIESCENGQLIPLLRK